MKDKDKKDFKCPYCNKKLFEAKGDFVVETKCRSCKRVVSFTSTVEKKEE